MIFWDIVKGKVLTKSKSQVALFVDFSMFKLYLFCFRVFFRDVEEGRIIFTSFIFGNVHDILSRDNYINLIRIAWFFTVEKPETNSEGSNMPQLGWFYEYSVVL